MPMQNPKQGNKWLCEKCHTYCVPEVPRCSWCGTARPAPKATPKPAPSKENEKK